MSLRVGKCRGSDGETAVAEDGEKNMGRGWKRKGMISFDKQRYVPKLDINLEDGTGKILHL